MFLENYISRSAQGISISAKQGSRFAKQIAYDFNPIHDEDSKRFCVPGDLLFALCLQRYGISESMHFQFAELLKADRFLHFPDDQEGKLIELVNDRQKVVLRLDITGETHKTDQAIEQLARIYVRFSGQNFPHILVPLMREQQVMFNPNRPLVIYEQMSLKFDRLEFTDLSIELAETQLEVQGKRGNAWLNFHLLDGQTQIGSGRKKLVLSGLRDYDEAAIQALCDEQTARQRALSKETAS